MLRFANRQRLVAGGKAIEAKMRVVFANDKRQYIGQQRLHSGDQGDQVHLRRWRQKLDTVNLGNLLGLQALEPPLIVLALLLRMSVALNRQKFVLKLDVVLVGLDTILKHALNRFRYVFEERLPAVLHTSSVRSKRQL